MYCPRSSLPAPQQTIGWAFRPGDADPSLCPGERERERETAKSRTLAMWSLSCRLQILLCSSDPDQILSRTLSGPFTIVTRGEGWSPPPPRTIEGGRMVPSRQRWHCIRSPTPMLRLRLLLCSAHVLSQPCKIGPS